MQKIFRRAATAAVCVTVLAVPVVGSPAASASTRTAAASPADPTAPTKPYMVKASPGDASATVTWAEPRRDGGSPITSYTVMARTGGTVAATRSVDAPNRTATVSGLTNGTAYTFVVTATNAVGTSPPSNPSAAVTPTAPTADPIEAHYQALGGSSSFLGEPVGAQYAIAGGRAQNYQGGTIYYSGATGAFEVHGLILSHYLELGGPGSAIGFPTGDEFGVKNGRASTFEGATIYWSATTGARAVSGPILAHYTELSGPSSYAGLPLTDVIAVTGGKATYFEGANIYLPTGGTTAYAVRGAILAEYLRLGGPDSTLSMPTSDELGVPGGRATTFGAGNIYWSATTGAHAVSGLIVDRYLGSAGPAGFAGLPVTDEAAVTGGQGQSFQGGNIYLPTDSAAAYAVRGAILAHYLAIGGPDSFAGLPTGDEFAVEGGRASTFRGATIYWSELTGAHAVGGAILAHYSAIGGPNSYAGLPTTDEIDVPGGRANYFSGANIYWSPGTGAQTVRGAILAEYLALGASGSFAGLPTADEDRAPGGRVSTFQGANIYWSETTGAHEVHGAVLAEYLALPGTVRTTFGLPVSDEAAVPGGRASSFSGGNIYWSEGTGAHEVHGAILAEYLAIGGSGSFAGLPTRDESGVQDGRASTFEGANIYWSAGTGAHEVHGAILAEYLEVGGPPSRLGLPTSDEFAVPGGRQSNFVGGVIRYDAATGRTCSTPNCP